MRTMGVREDRRRCRSRRVCRRRDPRVLTAAGWMSYRRRWPARAWATAVDVVEDGAVVAAEVGEMADGAVVEVGERRRSPCSIQTRERVTCSATFFLKVQFTISILNR
jgi:hypothetical protein